VKPDNHVSDFLHCCLKVLGDPTIAKKLTQKLTICMEEGETDTIIFALLPKRYVRHVSKRKPMGREFKMIAKIGNYDMDDVMLEMGSDVNILPKKSWELMC
jgi:hypothetical protein